MDTTQYERRNKLEIFRRPEVAQPLGQLIATLMGEGAIPAQLKSEMFTLLSLSSGCRHCQAHGAYGLSVRGVDVARIQALWTFEQSGDFSPAERAAYRLARDAGLVPNEVTAEHFRSLREHFTDAQISEMLGVVALSGFLNRYSDTLAVVTDQESVDWAQQYLAPLGWTAGKHTGQKSEQRTAAPFGRPVTSLVPE